MSIPTAMTRSLLAPLFLLLLLLLAATATVSSATVCKTNVDCNMAGKCLGNGTCECVHGFAGPTCSQLALGLSYKCQNGSLCLPNTSTWGGSVVRGDDGLYHMFAAMMSNNCSLSAWLTNSVVVHAVSSQPQGPYNYSDIALGPRPTTFWDGLTQHNPEIARAHDGTYLLFYMGSTLANATHQQCGGGRKSPLAGEQRDALPAAAKNQRIGLATAKSPYGPWTRPDTPTLAQGSPGSWDDLFVTNPTVHVMANGSVLMVYKGRSAEHSSEMLQGVAIASNYTSPFVKLSQTPMPVATNCEDSGITYDQTLGVYRDIMHCGCNVQYVWSEDGVTWNNTTPQQAWCTVNYSDGTHETLTRRERPKWIIVDGQPRFITNGVKGTNSHGGRTFTLVTRLD